MEEVLRRWPGVSALVDRSASMRTSFSKRDRPVRDASCSRRLTDTRAVVTIPHAERGIKLLSGDNCFGTQGRQTLGSSNFSYPVTDKAHRQDQDRFGKDQQPPPEFPPMFCRPSSSERAATCRRDASAEANVVEVRSGNLVVLDQAGQPMSLLVGQHLAQEMVVEDNMTHVVARSGSSASDLTKVA